MRSTTAKLAAGLLALSAWPLAPSGDAAAAPDGAPRATQTSYPVCDSFCAMQDQTCRQTSDAGDARCDTEYVSCVSSCTDCIPSAQACLRAAGGAQQACTGSLLTCIRGGLADREAAKAAPIRFEGGDGTSRETAVVILGARNESEGIVAETLWTAKHHDGWTKADKTLIHDGARSFDRIGYGTPDGKRDVWFDITGFFGKP